MHSNCLIQDVKEVCSAQLTNNYYWFCFSIRKCYLGQYLGTFPS